MTNIEKVARAEIEYLVKLADWAAGEGFCQLPNGMEEPEEWCFRQWSVLSPENGDGYSADALADRFIAAMQPAPQEPVKQRCPACGVTFAQIGNVDDYLARAHAQIASGQSRENTELDAPLYAGPTPPNGGSDAE